MTSDDDLQQRVRALEDRAAIDACIARHARGCDRHDVDLLCSAYMEDSVDEHGLTVNPGQGYATWANRVHAESASAHLHHLTTAAVEIDGDTAHAETYVMVHLLAPDQGSVTVLAGRYVDRLERVDGDWRIAVRRSVVELGYTASAAFLASPFFRQQGYPVGSRDHGDLAYARPLTIDSPSSRWG